MAFLNKDNPGGPMQLGFAILFQLFALTLLIGGRGR
jgi:hypothetical protein